MSNDVSTGGPEPRGSAAVRLRQVVSAHPIIVGVLLGSTVLGVVLGLMLLPDDWALIRRALGGAVAGAGCGLICTAPRIIG